LFNLERRLDVILYRAHFIARVRQASQLIEHGHIYVNKKIVKNKSILLKPGDVIECSKNLNVKRLILYNIAISKFWPYPPKYLNVNYRLLKISVLDKCSNNSLITQFPFFLNVDKVTRYYKTY
jgi:ribosomal protein S4